MLKRMSYPIHKNVLKRFSKKESEELYSKLITERAKIQNKPQESKQALLSLGNEKGGDQADQVSRHQEEVQYTSRIQKDNQKLKAIVEALARMERGEYGVCEQTGDTIEFKRLLSLPWTTLSIEGAEELENSSGFKVR